LLSKKTCWVFFTVFLYLVQSILLLDVQYTVRSLLQSSFHYALEFLVMLTCLEYLYQSFSIMEANFWVIFFSIMLLWLMPPGDSMEKGQGYDDMIGCAASSLSQYLMLLWDALDINNFYFSFGQWRGTWHCSHLTCHMMWYHKPRRW